MTFHIRFDGSLPEHNTAMSWCWANVGTQGIKWSWHYKRIQNREGYYVFCFDKRDDAVMFSLRFS